MSPATKRASSNGHAKPKTPLYSWSQVVGPAVQSVQAAIDALPDQARSLPSLSRLRKELPLRMMSSTVDLATKLRELTGRDIIDLETVQDLMSVAYRASAVRRHHRAGRWKVDEFGFDQEWTEVLLPLARLIYRKYWRVSVTGVENIPAGGALLVSNHAGVLPFDAAMIRVAVFDHGRSRHVRPLVATWMFNQPFVSWFMRRTGQTLGHPSDTHRLLTSGQLVLVFPEGINGTGKPFGERYNLQRFGRGGFVISALRAKVPIVPVSVIGSEETYPMLGDIKPLAKVLGLPYVPITPLGPIPLPSKWSIHFHEPVHTDSMEAASAEDPGVVMDISESVRDTIQQGLIDGLRERQSIWH